MAGEGAALSPMSMAALYCDERSLASGRAKGEVLAALVDNLSQQAGAMEVLPGAPAEARRMSIG